MHIHVPLQRRRHRACHRLLPCTSCRITLPLNLFILEVHIYIYRAVPERVILSAYLSFDPALLTLITGRLK